MRRAARHRSTRRRAVSVRHVVAAAVLLMTIVCRTANVRRAAHVRRDVSRRRAAIGGVRGCARRAARGASGPPRGGERRAAGCAGAAATAARKNSCNVGKMTSDSSFASLVLLNSANAHCHCWPFSHALILAV